MKRLTTDQIARIMSATEEVLEDTGVVVMHQGMLGRLEKAGARVDAASGTVRLPRQLLRELLSMAPRQYTISGSGGQRYDLGGGSHA